MSTDFPSDSMPRDMLDLLLTNEDAMTRYSSLSPAQRKSVVNGARGLFQEEMKAYIDRILLG